ncbi:hypothetical protein CHS0354_014317 [Potamilus streckersoni]|uniref:Uncharacterized protein n=1 Tax=Potamilus streckersoni TaxID=2493646 RepID=A0AAE0SL84_9BIVA|nr:hypothetical protein CHS0354_014317 [Potamilus streckersoni]
MDTVIFITSMGLLNSVTVKGLEISHTSFPFMLKPMTSVFQADVSYGILKLNSLIHSAFSDNPLGVNLHHVYMQYVFYILSILYLFPDLRIFIKLDQNMVHF